VAASHHVEAILHALGLNRAHLLTVTVLVAGCPADDAAIAEHAMLWLEPLAVRGPLDCD
jgi:hypothetical protein